MRQQMFNQTNAVCHSHNCNDQHPFKKVTFEVCSTRKAINCASPPQQSAAARVPGLHTNVNTRRKHTCSDHNTPEGDTYLLPFADAAPENSLFLSFLLPPLLLAASAPSGHNPSHSFSRYATSLLELSSANTKGEAGTGAAAANEAAGEEGVLPLPHLRKTST